MTITDDGHNTIQGKGRRLWLKDWSPVMRTAASQVSQDRLPKPLAIISY